MSRYLKKEHRSSPRLAGIKSCRKHLVCEVGTFSSNDVQEGLVCTLCVNICLWQ